MPKKIKPQMDLYLCILLSMLLSSASVYAQSNDAYLDALKGEASGLTLDAQTEIQPPKINPISTSREPSLGLPINQVNTSDGSIPKGLDMNSFLDHIKTNYFGTFIFMKRLSNTQKQEIYNFYTQNNDPQAIRAKVLSTSKKK